MRHTLACHYSCSLACDADLHKSHMCRAAVCNCKIGDPTHGTSGIWWVPSCIFQHKPASGILSSVGQLDPSCVQERAGFHAIIRFNFPDLRLPVWSEVEWDKLHYKGVCLALTMALGVSHSRKPVLTLGPLSHPAADLLFISNRIPPLIKPFGTNKPVTHGTIHVPN